MFFEDPPGGDSSPFLAPLYDTIFCSRGAKNKHDPTDRPLLGYMHDARGMIWAAAALILPDSDLA